MNREELRDFLRENLSIEVDVKTYSDPTYGRESTETTVRLYLTAYTDGAFSYAKEEIDSSTSYG